MQNLDPLTPLHELMPVRTLYLFGFTWLTTATFESGDALFVGMKGSAY
jgi:hypothetical protein